MSNTTRGAMGRIGNGNSIQSPNRQKPETFKPPAPFFKFYRTLSDLKQGGIPPRSHLAVWFLEFLWSLDLGRLELSCGAWFFHTCAPPPHSYLSPLDMNYKISK